MTPTLKGPRAVLLDLDGTVYQEGQLVPGAGDAVRRLRKAGLPVLFGTNTTRVSRADLVGKLRALGVDAAPDDLLTAPRAAAARLRAWGVRRIALYLPEPTFPDFDGFDEVGPGGGAEAVVVGDLGPQWTFQRLNAAFLQLLDGARLLALHRNRYWRTEDGLVLDAGPFVAALEHAAGVEATLAGKPSPAFFEAAARTAGVRVEDLLVVGDDLESEVAGARAVGARGVLVRTGKFRPEALDASPVRPDAVLASVSDVPAALGLP